MEKEFDKTLCAMKFSYFIHALISNQLEMVKEVIKLFDHDYYKIFSELSKKSPERLEYLKNDMNMLIAEINKINLEIDKVLGRL